jgi:hypothetical protein
VTSRVIACFRNSILDDVALSRSLFSKNLPPKELLPSFLAQILGAEVGDQDPANLVMERLAPCESLLLLDNFEPFLEQADWLGELLAAAPQLKLLITSQEPLRLQEEWILDLAGLETPREEIAVPEQAAGGRRQAAGGRQQAARFTEHRCPTNSSPAEKTIRLRQQQGLLQCPGAAGLSCAAGQ